MDKLEMMLTQWCPYGTDKNLFDKGASTKTFVPHSRIRRLGGWRARGLSESIRKGKFVMKMFFFIWLMLNEVLKICEKWYLLIKAKIKQEQTKI